MVRPRRQLLIGRMMDLDMWIEVISKGSTVRWKTRRLGVSFQAHCFKINPSWILHKGVLIYLGAIVPRSGCYIFRKYNRYRNEKTITTAQCSIRSCSFHQMSYLIYNPRPISDSQYIHIAVGGYSKLRATPRITSTRGINLKDPHPPPVPVLPQGYELDNSNLPALHHYVVHFHFQGCCQMRAHLLHLHHLLQYPLLLHHYRRRHHLRRGQNVNLQKHPRTEIAMRMRAEHWKKEAEGTSQHLHVRSN